MFASIVWWQVLVGFALGWLLGQRFSHMHPIPSVKNGG